MSDRIGFEPDYVGAGEVASTDARLPPTPSGAGKTLYDTGSAYVALPAGSSGQVLTSGGAGAPSWATPSAGISIYGDGSDGDVTISGGTTTLARDMVYDTLTISGTGVLKTAGYRVYCKTACIVQSGGVIHNDGNAASGATQGATPSAATLGGGGAGGGGQTGAGTGGSGVTVAFGGAGGAGGAGTGGSGGSGATVTAPGASNGTAWAGPMVAMGCFAFGTGLAVYKGGGGGGGGGGNSSANGGGGGGSGGVVLIVAKSITNSGAIRAKGGAGAAGTASNCGGGGGGGGGLVVLVCGSFSGTVPDVSGGAQGASGGGSGVAGSAGSAGSYKTITH